MSHVSDPTPQTMKISDVKNQLSSLVNDVYRSDTRILIEKSGIPVAAIISSNDLKRYAQLEREREERFAVVDRMREAFADVSSEEIEQEATRSVAATRERRRRRVTKATARSA